MIAHTIDDLARGAGPGLNRRFSLAALGAVARAIAKRPASTDAANANKKERRNARKRCQRQRGPCEAVVREILCGGDEECLAELLPCCGLLARCSFAAFITCADSND
jgi:hypothetical protein